MIKLGVLFRIGLALALALTLSAGRASASLEIATFNLTDSNMGSGFTGPFVKVTVDLTDATHATLTFDSLTNGGYTYLLAAGGGAGAAAGNISGSFSLLSFSGTPYESGAPALSDGGSGNMDGYGSFNQRVSTGAGGPDNAYTQITFTVLNTSGSWTDTGTGTGGVFEGNDKGNFLAAHIGALASGEDAFAKTGDADHATRQTVITATSPEPSTMALAALGTLGFLGYGLRRRLSK